MIRNSRWSTLRSLKIASTEMGSVAEMIEPNSNEMSNGMPISEQLPHIELHTAFKDQRGKKQDQDHIRRKPIWTVTWLKRRGEGNVESSQKHTPDDERDRVRDSQALRKDGDDRGDD